MADLGERAIVRLLKERYSAHERSIGDDCAIITQVDGVFVVATTDPAPRPVCWELGYQDYYYWGWLLAALNLSDVNASGARPAGFLSSLTLPADFLMADFDRLLQGIDDACAAAETEVVGGNIKEDMRGLVTCEGTAFGTVTGTPISRGGARPGQVLVAIGPTGYFWSAMQLLRHGRDCQADLLGHFLTPTPMAPLGSALHASGLVSAGSDASDGLYAAAASLTDQHGLGATLDPLAWEVSPLVAAAGAELGVAPWRLALGFGDLQFVCAIHENDLERVSDIAESQGATAMRIGSVDEARGIRAIDEIFGIGEMTNFDNERFTAQSQFTQGLSGYEAFLMSAQLLSGAHASTTDQA